MITMERKARKLIVEKNNTQFEDQQKKDFHNKNLEKTMELIKNYY